MKLDTSKLEGAALDWAVAKAEKWDGETLACLARQYANAWPCNNRTPSTDWSQGGPLVDRYRLTLYPSTDYETGNVAHWVATDERADFPRGSIGPAPLIAAMRAIVAAELGDEVDVPDELLEGA